MEHNSQIRIPRVKLGSQGFEVSKLGFGCVGLSGAINTPLSHEAGCSILKEAFNKGITFFDTSNSYGREGDNEIMIGKALKQLPREQVQLATKFGFIISEDFQVQVKGTPEFVRKCCEESLKRLDVNYIDLYYPHRTDTTVPIEETMEALKKLVEEGKIRYIGLSEASVDTIKRAHVVHPITAVQMEYSLWTREIEEDVIPLCRELGIGIVAYSPLGHGFFAGKGVTESLPTRSIMCSHPRFIGENLEKNKVLYTRFTNLAAKHGCTPPQLALAWLMHQGDDVVPIPGTTKIKNLNDNIQSLGVKFTPDDVKEITDSIPISEAKITNIQPSTTKKLPLKTHCMLPLSIRRRRDHLQNLQPKKSHLQNLQPKNHMQRKRKKMNQLHTDPLYQRDYGVLVAAYAEYISDEILVPTHALDVDYLRRRYVALLWKYDSDKACDDYVNENDDPPKPREHFTTPDNDRLIDIS